MNTSYSLFCTSPLTATMAAHLPVHPCPIPPAGSSPPTRARPLKVPGSLGSFLRHRLPYCTPATWTPVDLDEKRMAPNTRIQHLGSLFPKFFFARSKILNVNLWLSIWLKTSVLSSLLILLDLLECYSKSKDFFIINSLDFNVPDGIRCQCHLWESQTMCQFKYYKRKSHYNHT